MHYYIKALEEKEINVYTICYVGNQMKLNLVWKCQPHYLLINFLNSDCLLVYLHFGVGQESCF